MAEIFLSYKKCDADRVRPLVGALEAQGWSVWWDTRLGAGEQWDEVIERELSRARCVVVVWSRESVASRWVRTEASEGLERGILVPILIDDVAQPLAFRLIQSVSLMGCSLRDGDPRWAQVLRAVGSIAGRNSGRADEEVPTETAAPAPELARETRPGAFWIEIGPPGAVTVRQLAAKQSFADVESGPEMVVVPPGAFLMGSPASEDERRDNEGPEHRVTIGRPFAVGKQPVTVGQYAVFVNKSGHVSRARQEIWEPPSWQEEDGRWVLRDIGDLWRGTPETQKARQPVVLVSWNDATAYAAWLARVTGRRYRLLSEAEWEYAARAGTTTPVWWGKSSSPANAVYDASTVYLKGKRGEPARGPRDPALSNPNPFGLHDMLGNVAEWVEDYIHADYAATPRDGSPCLKKSITEWRGIRGGGWSSPASDIRAAARSGGSEDRAWPAVGFRVARDIE